MVYSNAEHIRTHDRTIKLSTYHLWICFACLACIVIISPISYFSFVAPSSSRVEREVAKITASQISDGFSAQVNILRVVANDFAKDQELIEILRGGDDEDLTIYVKRAKQNSSIIKDLNVHNKSYPCHGKTPELGAYL